MATNVAFRDGGKTSEEGIARLLSKLIGTSGVLSSTDLKVSAASTPDNTVKIAVGDCVIGVLAPSASDYSYHGWVSSQDSVTIAANASGNPRKDAIVAYIDTAIQDDTIDDNPGVLKFKDVTGTPAASPTAPDTTAIQSSVGSGNPWIRLAEVTVANGFSSITSGVITDTRTVVGVSMLGTGANLLGYAAVSGTQASITSDTDLTGGSVTVTVPASGRQVKITGVVHVTSTVADDYAELEIKEGATVLQTVDRRVNSVRVSTIEAVYISPSAPSAGSHTYKLTLSRGSGTGTLTSTVASGFVAFILVELV